MPLQRCLRSAALLLSCAPAVLAQATPPAPSPVQPAPKAPEGPQAWRVQTAWGLPEWLKVSGMQRTRFETLDGQFRADSSAKTYDASDHLFALRTQLRADARYGGFDVSAELMDSRQYEADRGSALDTGTVNAVELIQMFGAYEAQSLFRDGDRTHVLLGRHTMDLGNRRLVARNDYRNTTNTFDGLNVQWETAAKSSLRAFYTLPVRRLPFDLDGLLDNDAEFDDSNTHVQFWGVYGTWSEIAPKVQGELYYLGLREQDATGLATANRDLTTIGTRFVRRPAKEQLDFEFEGAYQFGESRTNSASATDLDHEALLTHVEGGYSFDADYKPRLSLLLDYASGDKSPNDSENNRFDPLYGARRWEWGPTGIFGALARSNVISPGWRLAVAPQDKLDVMLGHRLAYLAAAKDAYVPGNVRDPSGDSGDFIGNLLELRMRWNVVPGNLTFEFGVAQLFAGSFLEDAPNATGNGDTSYAYVQMLISF